MRSFPPNTGDDCHFWHVNNVGNEQGEIAANAAKLIGHKGTIHRHLLQRLADNIEAMVDEPVLHDAVEGLLKSNKLGTG